VAEAPSVATPAVPAPATFRKSLRANFTGKTRHPTRDAGKEPLGHPARFVVDHAPCDVVVLRYAAPRSRTQAHGAAPQQATDVALPTSSFPGEVED
jgi:hypothetical protein